MKKTLFVAILIWSYIANAQYFFQYRADLPHIDSTYFYNIFLPPKITSKLNYKFSDIRIYDIFGKEIPYIRDTEENRYKTAKRTKLKIIQNEHKVTKRYTVVMLHNPTKEKISNLVFLIKNTDAEIWVNISGSNDLKTWQILKTNVRYQQEFSDSATTELIISDLPESDFEYYRILFFDYNREPIIVLDAYTFYIQKREPQYVEVPKPKFFQDDTSEPHKTILRIVFDEPQYIDKIVFDISAPEFYLRRAELTTRDTTTGRKIKLQYYYQGQKDFYLCSDSTNELLLSRYYAKELYLVVENNNNEPLKFADVRAYQEKEYLIAKLQKGKKYYLKFGNKNVPPPIYDLKYFRNKIPDQRPTITPTKITKLTNPKEIKNSIYIKPIYLWIALGIVVIILIFISINIFRKYKFEDLM